MSNAVTTTSPKPPIMAGGQVAALVPQSLDEAFRVSQAIASSGLAPRGLDKPEQIMVAIMAGAELGLAPFQALQSFAVVNGRPTLWGDGLMAVARAQGIKAHETIEGEGDDMIAYCTVVRPDTGEQIDRQFSVADARKAGLWNKTGPWQQYPRRMLQMRARAWALRDGCADMLRGFQVREEVEDYQPVRDVTPRQAPNLAARLAAPKAEDAPAEGFSVHNALGDDDILEFDAGSPAASDEPSLAEQDAPAGEGDFPGDGGTTAGPAEANADEGSGLAVDVIAWADALIRDLPFVTPDAVAALETNRKELAKFAVLRATDLAKAKELEKAINSAKDGTQ
ncbi:hypothetical protein [Brevundimonas sp. Root1279]|uniref:hypothetical protein n=1 Tax=Brevundimonas sp. Root1279 TaxID=1736443 RepID=UPI0006FB5EAF|nr:hypothetical protein [Brevundimonas sp. Root1279]KQW79752.1 hypothetical protein ASC65_14485 [Brevundimonas sp. Root1279]